MYGSYIPEGIEHKLARFLPPCPWLRLDASPKLGKPIHPNHAYKEKVLRESLLTYLLQLNSIGKARLMTKHCMCCRQERWHATTSQSSWFQQSQEPQQRHLYLHNGETVTITWSELKWCTWWLAWFQYLPFCCHVCYFLVSNHFMFLTKYLATSRIHKGLNHSCNIVIIEG